MMCQRPNDCPHCRVRVTFADDGMKRKWDSLMTALRMSPVDTPAEMIVSRATRCANLNLVSTPVRKVSVMRSQIQHEEATDARAKMMLKLFKKGLDTDDIARRYRVPEAEVQRLLSIARKQANDMRH